MEKKMSVKIKTIAVIITVISAFYLFVYIQRGGHIFLNWSDVDSCLAVLFTAAVLLLTISGVGLFFLKEWARRASIVGAIMLLIHLGYIAVMSLSNIVEAGLFFSIDVFLWALTLSGADVMAPLILFFFTRPKVKEQFSAKKIGGSAFSGK